MRLLINNPRVIETALSNKSGQESAQFPGCETIFLHLLCPETRRRQAIGPFFAANSEQQIIESSDDGLTLGSVESILGEDVMTAKRGSWKLERASVHHRGQARAKSNKYSKNDQDERPLPHTRSKVWVGAYLRANGRRVEGHFRFMSKTLAQSNQ